MATFPFLALTPLVFLLWTSEFHSPRFVRTFFEESPEPPEDMVFVPAGEFPRGDNAGLPNERPTGLVYLDAYHFGKTEVTNGQYHAFWVATGGERSPHTPKSFGGEIGYWPDVAQTKPDCPVVGVRWRDALAYAQWRGCRLPTEAEWEKGARGTIGSEFPWGNDFAMPIFGRNHHANIWNGSDGFDNHLAPVGSYPTGISRFGAYDLGGNAAEWVSDWYSETYYHWSPRRNPKGPSAGTWRVVRGGSWMSGMDSTRGAARWMQHPSYGTSFIGFRIAKSAEQ